MKHTETLSAIENDIRSLMLQVADAKLIVVEKEREHDDGMRRMLMSLLDAVDAFDRVFRAIHQKEEQVTPQMKIWIGNFRSVRRLLEKLLEEAGVTPLTDLAGRFDPAWQKAAEAIVDTSRPEGTVVDELKRGYLWKGQLLRKAEVTVVRHEAEETD